MPLSKDEIAVERKRLEDTIGIIKEKISKLGVELYDNEEKILEFKKFLWDSHTQMDPTEMKNMMSDNDVEISIMTNKGQYLQKLFRIQNNPYFGSIVFQDKEGIKNIYIGITHVEKDLEYYVYDWRSPICSMFYDYETGPASYEAPLGTIEGVIQQKRQYTIQDGKLIHVFDNAINIDDELLQEVLATESTDKMKNIVNTIQLEQNEVIRNIKDKNLIVQGIAGSGKTSVALHRIAFLLYKIPYLTSNHVLIFSPNNIFSKYISNVLPELGEDNTMQTTYHDYLKSYLKEFKEVESFTGFIERYYQKNIKSQPLEYKKIQYKVSDEIIEDMKKFIDDLTEQAYFTGSILTKDIFISKDELNQMLKQRYSHFPLFQRIEVIAEKICDRFYEGKLGKKKSITKQLLEILTVKKDYITIYNQFFVSKYCYIDEIDNNQIINKKILSYEDATVFVYMKSLLEGVDYNTDIEQIVIDEAQDYTKLQYYLLSKIFKNANYTILGDINQTINPYYKYNSLEILNEVFPCSKYIELLKTYRSSEEIIQYTNKILNLNHISAIRRKNKHEVIEKKKVIHLKIELLHDISKLQADYKSIAIITKSEQETNEIYQLLKSDIQITKIKEDSTYDRKLVILPAYIAKGLEFDSVIIYTNLNNQYTKEEKYLFYVACTRAQHQLIVYHQNTI